jgi:hypothetical protein
MDGGLTLNDLAPGHAQLETMGLRKQAQVDLPIRASLCE